MRIDKLLLENERIWKRSLSNEIGILTQGMHSFTGNDTMDFIPYSQVLKNKKVGCTKMVHDICLTKSEKYRARLTIGGDVLEYLRDSSSPAA